MLYDHALASQTPWSCPRGPRLSRKDRRGLRGPYSARSALRGAAAGARLRADPRLDASLIGLPDLLGLRLWHRQVQDKLLADKVPGINIILGGP